MRFLFSESAYVSNKVLSLLVLGAREGVEGVGVDEGGVGSLKYALMAMSRRLWCVRNFLAVCGVTPVTATNCAMLESIEMNLCLNLELKMKMRKVDRMRMRGVEEASM